MSSAHAPYTLSPNPAPYILNPKPQIPNPTLLRDNQKVYLHLRPPMPRPRGWGAPASEFTTTMTTTTTMPTT